MRARRGGAWRTLAPWLLASLALVGCHGRARTGAAARAQPRTGPALATFDFSAGLPEAPPENMLGLASRKHTFDEALRAMERARKDGDVKGIFVRFGGAPIGLARAQEIGDALAKARADKPVHCHAEGFTNATYFAAARGCTKIFVAPAGEVETIGLAAQIVYMRKLLVDELKLSVDILQVGKYKGAEEPLTRDGPSEEARASLEGVLSDMRDGWLEGFRASRPAVEKMVEEGPHSAVKAKERGLVDDVSYADEVRDHARTEVGAVRDDARFGGPGAGDGKDGDLGDVLRVLSGETPSAPIALVRASGSIRMHGEGGLFGDSGGINDKDLGRELSRVEKDDRIKALVFRIDSPGGSALASDLLWHQLMRIRAKKPIVVSVGEMAASGGYYLASTGNVIVADPASILGSIGVVGGKIGLGDALERFGVHAETFPAKKGDPEAAVRAAYLSPFVHWDDKTRDRIRESMTGIYDLFLRRVGEGRNLPVDKITPHAEGQIFSGREAKKRGLVDEIGGLTFAIAKAKELAKLPEDAKLVVFQNRPSLLDLLGADEDDGPSSEAARPGVTAARVAASALVGDVPAEVRAYLEAVAPLSGRERTVLVSPFAFSVR